VTGSSGISRAMARSPAFMTRPCAIGDVDQGIMKRLACLSSMAARLILSQMAVAVVPTPYAPPPGAIDQPPSGLYVLDQAISFNVLDAVAIDTETGAITLFGHRDRRYGNAQIPYFDLLATFTDYPRPRFNLMPTPDSVRMSRNFFKGEYGDRILNAFGQLYSSGEANQDVRLLLGVPSPNPTQSECRQPSSSSLLHKV
jgi:hypothetical protein